jgi:beta-1,4-mannosyltransferase
MGSTTAGELADRLTSFVVDALEASERRHLPGWAIPRTFAGHLVGADVRADVCYTLHHLAGSGVAEVAGTPIDDVLVRLLGEVDGRSTHTFFSYRIAETLLRHGPFEGNPLLAGLTEAQRDQLAIAVDSSDWLELLDAGVLPRNYAGVLSRCELGRVQLGLVTDTTRLDELVARVAKVVGGNPRRALDDSNDRIGRYDIYTADVWLFTEPLADRLGPVWDDGITKALELVLAVGSRDGSAVPWGRSTGDLAAALTLELAALALAEGRAGGRDAVWLRRAHDAALTLVAGFDDDGVTTSHVRRAQDSYRGPERRLQLTFDLLGKIAWAAGALARVDPALVAAPVADAYPPGDRWLPFEDERPAGAWAHRSPGADFVVPFVGTSRSHYLPALHQPGTWEVPVDRDLPTWTPLVVHGLRRYTAGGLPAAVEHGPGSVTATWDALPVSGRGLDGDDPGPPLAAGRSARFAVDGRAVVLDDHLTFDVPPVAVSLAIPEVAGRPLHVTWESDSPHLTSTVSVAGLAEWRSSWSEIERVHQIDLEPATEVRFRARVTPLLRVASTEVDHHYHRSLYGPMTHRVVARRTPVGWNTEPDPGFRHLDLLHLHWPEWLAFDDLDAHTAIIDELRDNAVPVVWTAHNLTPHEKRAEVFDAIYQAWAASVDAVIHHSAWGEARMRERYRFAEGCRHEVIPHGHFGRMWERSGLPDRAEAERRLGLSPAGLRIGIVGAPRAEKLVQAVLDGVAACGRDDVQLVCWSLGPDDVVPDDPRIAIAEPYATVDRGVYATRLAACDTLALVFDEAGEMLTTGAAADAVGLGLPALRSDWGYLVEHLGDAGVPVGQTAASIAAALDALTPAVLEQAAAASQELRAGLDWSVLAERTADLFERTVLRQP